MLNRTVKIAELPRVRASSVYRITVPDGVLYIYMNNMVYVPED